MSEGNSDMLVGRSIIYDAVLLQIIQHISTTFYKNYLVHFCVVHSANQWHEQTNATSFLAAKEPR